MEKRLFVMVLLSLLFQRVWAVEEQQFEEGVFFDDLPVVLTVTRLPQAQTELPASVSIIDREMIEASGAVEVPQLLRLVAGFQVGHVNASRSTVTYHGMADEYARRMQVLVDGRSIYLSATGSVDWYDIPLSIEDIDRIEVIRGPNGVTYGSNSFLGVINIITKHPHISEGVTVKHEQGEFGFQTTTARYAAQEDAYHYRLTMEQHKDTGTYNYVDETGDLFVPHDNREFASFNYRGEWRPAINDYFSFQLGYRAGDYGVGFEGHPTQPPVDEGHRRMFIQGRWKRVLSSTEDLELQLYHIRSKNGADYKLATLAELLSPVCTTPAATFPVGSAEYIALTDLQTHCTEQIVIKQSVEVERTDLELQHRLQLNKATRLVWGGELRQDNVTSPGFIGDASPVVNELARLFTHVEWKLADDWLLNAGAMYEDSKLGGENLSPRIALNYLYNPAHSVRTSYTRAYRNPAVLEEYADYGARFEDGSLADQVWVSKGDIKPEEISAYEIALTGRFDPIDLSYDFKLFRHDMTRLVASPIDKNYQGQYSALCPYDSGIDGVFCRSTVIYTEGNASTEGAELQATMRFGKLGLVNLGYSVVNVKTAKLIKDINPDRTFPAEYVAPQESFSALVQVPLGGRFYGSVGYYRVGDMYLMGGDRTNGYETADVRIARDISVFGLKGLVELKAQNVLGEYYDYGEYYNLDAIAYLSVEMQLN